MSQMHVDPHDLTQNQEVLLTRIFESYAKDEKFLKLQTFKKFLFDIELVSNTNF
jgi:hypothetical protein